MSYNTLVKPFRWNTEKNLVLTQERGVSFESVELAIAQGNLLDVLQHTNQDKYPNQQIFLVRLGNYAYLVPFVEDEKEIFLKAIIPSRKATKEYLQRLLIE